MKYVCFFLSLKDFVAWELLERVTEYMSSTMPHTCIHHLIQSLQQQEEVVILVPILQMGKQVKIGHTARKQYKHSSW